MTGCQWSESAQLWNEQVSGYAHKNGITHPSIFTINKSDILIITDRIQQLRLDFVGGGGAFHEVVKPPTNNVLNVGL